MKLLGSPRLLILDEPTNGMDPEGTREILTFLRERVQTDGLSVFISSHLLYEVEEYCDTVFVINKGRLIASGRVKDILTPHERIVRVTFEGEVPDRQMLMADETQTGTMGHISVHHASTAHWQKIEDTEEEIEKLKVEDR